MTVSFDAFLEQAWTDHADRPEEVATRLGAGYALIEDASQIGPFARILAHVDGEHLARWTDGIARLERLRTLPHWRDDGDGAVLVRRLVAALQMGGGGAPAPGLAAADLAQAHAVAAAALAAQHRPDAIRHYRSALTAAAAGLPDGDPAIRALAVTSNNLAATLEEQADRSIDETTAMLEAAGASREWWGRAGGWLEAERAEFMLAKCLLAAGDPLAALGHARQCVAMCEDNDADAFEQFFAQAVLALAHRAHADAEAFAGAKASALALHATLAADQKPWCEPMLRQLA